MATSARFASEPGPCQTPLPAESQATPAFPGPFKRGQSTGARRMKIHGGRSARSERVQAVGVVGTPARRSYEPPTSSNVGLLAGC